MIIITLPNLFLINNFIINFYNNILQEMDTNDYDLQSYFDSFKPKKTFDHVCIGGTFDHLHVGHRYLLTCALKITNEKLTIGLTGKY